MPEKKYVNEDDLVDMGVLKSKRTAGRAVKNGLLPPGTLMGNRMIWRMADVEAHIAARAGPVPRKVVRGAK